MRYALLVAACASAPAMHVVDTGHGLVDAGAEPRESIRLRYAAGATHRTHSVWMVKSQPPLDLLVDSSVDSVDADGTAKVRYTTVDVVLPATADKKASEALEPYRHQVFVSTITPRGETVARAKVAGPDPGEDWLSRLGFPEEAIGVGAKWDDHATVDLGGTTMTLVGHRTLTKRDGDTLVVHTQLEASGKSDQGIEFGITGDGDTTYHLAAPLAQEGHGAIDMSIAAGGKPQTLHMEITTTAAP